jgi:Ca2+-binding RTX toxin-like protein
MSIIDLLWDGVGLKRLFPGGEKPSRRSHHPAQPRRTRPVLESLEKRDVPAIYEAGIGLVVVDGTNQKDEVTIKPSYFFWQPVYDVIHVVRDNDGRELHRELRWFFVENIDKIIFHGQGGDDWFQNDTGVTTEAHGDRGRDTLVGGSGRDFLYGEWDDDRLEGRGGDDDLFGGAGWDELYGDFGLYGDYVDIGWGNDYLDGGFDGIRDSLRGGSGLDTYAVRFRYNYDTGGYVYEYENIFDTDQRDLWQIRYRYVYDWGT